MTVALSAENERTDQNVWISSRRTEPAVLLPVVADHLATALPYYASVHRGAGFASQVSTALLENSRACVATFLGAREDDVTIFVRNTTDALNLLAGAVPAGGSVLCLDLEHTVTVRVDHGWKYSSITVIRPASLKSMPK
jgi:selenocysteine lyase/cysteine desulfurase